MDDTQEILFEEIPGTEGNIGLVTLNRPQALNALTHAMCIALHKQLAKWAAQASIKAVVIQGNGDKAFCAGGDIRQIYALGKNGDVTTAYQFFWDEYRLNHFIHHFPKPYIALLHGITMGGGVGASIHGSHRIAAEQLLFAMPETGIGFFPDIGASYFLPRCPGTTGYYLGLTGARINAADALYLNLVNAIVPKQQFAILIQTIANTPFGKQPKIAIDNIVRQFKTEPVTSQFTVTHSLIDKYFCHPSIPKILTVLSADPDPWCQAQLALLKTKSPTSLFITLRALQIGSQQDFDKCLQLEYQLACNFLDAHDFYEGIRAAVIDKDQTPHWLPPTIQDISTADIDQYFTFSRSKKLLSN